MNKNPKINVLYLDDEINNLASLKASFRKHYNIFTAETAQIATNILEEQNSKEPENNIHVILSDQRMPQITGVAFFESIFKTLSKSY